MNASFRRGFAAVFCRRRLRAGGGAGGTLGGLTAQDDGRALQSTARRHATNSVDRETHSPRPAATPRRCFAETLELCDHVRA